MSDNVTIDVPRAAQLLKDGCLVALPTETVYGLGASAIDPVAVARIFNAKQRPFFDPLIVHVPDIDSISQVAREFPPLARRLAERFWPGPLTLVLPKTDLVPDLVTAGMPTVGVRIPDHPLTQQVLRLAGIPIAAPSANPFGRLSPTTAEHVLQQLGDRIDAILDGGPCRVGVESTILRVDGDDVTLLRPGGTPLEAIESLIGPVGVAPASSTLQVTAPGMLPSHYAPRTPLIVVDQISEVTDQHCKGLLTLTNVNAEVSFAAIERLTSNGDLVQAAANFFQALHRLDAQGLDLIVAVRFPDQGLGRALNDRLQRAAHRE